MRQSQDVSSLLQNIMNDELISNNDVLDQFDQERIFLEINEDDECNDVIFAHDPYAMYEGNNGDDDDVSDSFNFGMHITDVPQKMWI